LPASEAIDGGEPGFAVYVHWPFCLSKCPYCDFNSHVRERIEEARWRSAILAELAHFAAETEGRRVTSIFFGGGTPSLMAPETAGAVIEAVGRLWPVAPDLEVTLEANPTSVETGRLAAFRQAGVGRVSLGVQALDDGALAFLGRRHGAAEAMAAVESAAAVFDRFSFDLIYARPGQTVPAWTAELRAALALAGGHLSVYQLTIEPGTAFHALAARGDLVLPDEDGQAALYEATQEILEDAGLPAYEISNHARAGEACRHNLTYWRYGDYVGVGPGAHGRLSAAGTPGKVATRTHRAPELWLERVERVGHGEHEREKVAPAAAAEEALMMGLRLAEGVPFARLAALAGRPAQEVVDIAAAERLEAMGLLARGGGRIAATPAGRQRLNAVLARLLV
jgi:oxygen-independent coproporphyrinogen-3 oxidase